MLTFARSRIAAAVVILGSFMTPQGAQALDFSGSYSIQGTNPDGSTFTGPAIIKLVRGDIYNIKWNFDANPEVGICIGEEDRLSCAYRRAGGDGAYSAGVIIYDIGNKGKLVGRWIDERYKKLGREILTPTSQ